MEQRDWDGVFAHYHTDDVLMDVQGQPPTHGIQEHDAAMKAFVESTGRKKSTGRKEACATPAPEPPPICPEV